MKSPIVFVYCLQCYSSTHYCSSGAAQRQLGSGDSVEQRWTRNLSYRWQTCMTSCLQDIHLQTIGWLWNWGWGHSRSSKVPSFGSSGIVSYLTSIATVAVSCAVSEIHWLIGQKSSIFLTRMYLAPPLGVMLSELGSNPRWWKIRMMGLSGGKRILTKSLAILIQSMRVTQTDGINIAYTHASIASCR